MVNHRVIRILSSSGGIAFVVFNTSATAQIIPDRSLGSEGSIVTPGVQTDKGSIDRIDGGAIRGNNLFHSFQDFSIGNTQKVYFANPSGIQNILGRVTGNQTSQILGTLGVLGNANLYLINPNGIIFGQNARLDIPGSFFASTSRNLVLENGYKFSTQNPESPPLLTINVRPGLESWLPDRGTITNSGNLAVGQNLTLVANTLDLQGQLKAGNNLTLQAGNTIRVQDSVTNPFIATAGEQLLVQGNEINIFALNNPASGFFSGKNMVFRSTNPINGDAHFYSGGNFTLENINGNPGDLSSVNDPIIRASGDVSFNSYTGASLHIFAGGSVTIDSINITSADPNNFINETVTLSDGMTTVAINGSQQPTVDIRAGIANMNLTGITGEQTGFSENPITNGTATSAAININKITNQSGLVFLSNQYQPNSNLSGDITVTSLISTASVSGGGNVVIDSRGGIITPKKLDVSGGLDSSPPPRYTSPGGNITLLSQGDILMPNPSEIFSYGAFGGSITLQSRSAIIQADAPSAESYIESAGYVSGQGGNVTLNAPFIYLSNFVQSNLRRGAAGPGGNLIITADSLQANQAQISNITRGGDAGNVIINANSITLNDSRLGSQTVSATGGKAGDVEINTNTLVGTNGGQIFSQTESLGNSGNIRVTATDSITFTGTNYTGIFSGLSSIVFPDSEGNGGVIKVKTGYISLTNGGQIRTSTRGIGNAGSINIEAQRGILIDGGLLLTLPDASTPVTIPSAIFSEVLSGSQGQGNSIEINTSQLSVSNGGSISASTRSVGNAGSILINASESVSFDGNPGEPFTPSRATVSTLRGATGQGGTLTINTGSLSVTNGARLEALTETGSNAGNIITNAQESVFLSGANTGLFSNTTSESTGNAGSIFIDPQRVEIRNGAEITVDSQGSGLGGNIEIRANNLTLDNQGQISARAANKNGGNITLELSDLLLLRRESQISSTAGITGAGGDGGNININAEFIVAFPQENSDITANAFLGKGGNVDITATSVFGIQVRQRITPLSDITASSETGISGTVVINNPEVNPSNGLVQLPEKVSDPSNQVVVGCAAADGNSFTITGRGGLPVDPTAPIRGQTLLSDLRDFTNADLNHQAQSTPHSQRSTQKVRSPILEATRWVRNKQGQVELVADSQETPRQYYPSCVEIDPAQKSTSKSSSL